MKRRILKRRRDGKKQHYWVGRQKKNYGALFKIKENLRSKIPYKEYKDFETGSILVTEPNMDKEVKDVEFVWDMMQPKEKPKVGIMLGKYSGKAHKELMKKWGETPAIGYYNIAKIKDNPSIIGLFPKEPGAGQILAHEIGHHLYDKDKKVVSDLRSEEGWRKAERFNKQNIPQIKKMKNSKAKNDEAFAYTFEATIRDHIKDMEKERQKRTVPASKPLRQKKEEQTRL